MPNLFRGYCYPSLSDAANAEISLPAMPADDGVAVAVAFSALADDTANITYRFLLPSGQSDYILTRVYPSCSSVGYLTNYSGLELSDVIEVSFGIVLCWAVAFGFKTMRRAL
ncbi:hypothetical protein [Methylomicrobium agile]|nr:hypothetical protein [Methylomicrobium agile]